MGKKTKKAKNLPSPSSAQSNTPETAIMDDELVDDLLSQLDARDETVQTEAATVLTEMQQRAESEATPQAQQYEKKDSKARFKARAMRKAAALAEIQAPVDAEADANLEREAKTEDANIQRICAQYDLEIHEINPDGHCLFSAIADQLLVLGILSAPASTYATTRHAAAQYMLTHQDEFIPFLPSIDGEDGAGATSDSGLMTPVAYQRYCSTIRDTGAWGGEPEILALSRAYNIPIHVIQSAAPGIVVHTPTGKQDHNVQSPNAARISYHRYMYGLGEHYNSLRPKAHGLARVVQALDRF